MVQRCKFSIELKNFPPDLSGEPLKEQNVPIEMISELLGHKSIKTTQIYLRSFSLGKMTEVNSACFGGVYNYESQAG